MIKPDGTPDMHFIKSTAYDPAEDLKRKADRICSLILVSDYPDVDIDIEIRNLRKWCERRLPERRELFEIIYVNRFLRLREQFRSGKDKLR